MNTPVCSIRHPAHLLFSLFIPTEVPRIFYQYFVHFLSFPVHLWKLIDNRPNVSVQLEIKDTVANNGKGRPGKHKEELVSQKIQAAFQANSVPQRSGEKQLLVGSEHRPVRVRVVLEVDVPTAKPSVGHQLCLHFFFSSFPTPQVLSFIRTVASSASTVWKHVHVHHTPDLYLSYRFTWPACHPSPQGITRTMWPHNSLRNTRLSWLLDGWFSRFGEPVEANLGVWR